MFSIQLTKSTIDEFLENVKAECLDFDVKPKRVENS